MRWARYDNLPRFSTDVGHVGEVMTSSHLFFFSYFMLFRSTLPVSMVPLSKRELAYYFLYSSYRFFDSDRPGIWFVLHPLGIYLIEATRT